MRHGNDGSASSSDSRAPPLTTSASSSLAASLSRVAPLGSVTTTGAPVSSIAVRACSRSRSRTRWTWSRSTALAITAPSASASARSSALYSRCVLPKWSVPDNVAEIVSGTSTDATSASLAFARVDQTIAPLLRSNSTKP